MVDIGARAQSNLVKIKLGSDRSVNFAKIAMHFSPQAFRNCSGFTGWRKILLASWAQNIAGFPKLLWSLLDIQTGKLVGITGRVKILLARWAQNIADFPKLLWSLLDNQTDLLVDFTSTGPVFLNLTFRLISMRSHSLNYRQQKK